MIDPRATFTSAAALALAGCASLPGAGPAPRGHPGLVAMASPHAPDLTLARLEAQLKQRNLAVVAKVDHAAGARAVGQSLRPTTLVIFGNPQAGTPLMQCAQTMGIDLPMKALVWVDADGRTWLGYTDPAWTLRHHGGGDCPPVANVQKALAAIASATVAP
jgi:uncharacterized protein (DUF302 family)